MARGIYEIKIDNGFFLCLNAEEALEMFIISNNGIHPALEEPEISVAKVVMEEHTVRLSLLAKGMYDTRLFRQDEIELAVEVLARELGYDDISSGVAKCVTNQAERFYEEMTLSEFEEWLMS